MQDSGESLGSRVRALRRAAGLSQTDLAGDDLSPSYVSLVEADRRAPSASTIAALAARLGVTPTFLETGEEEPRDVQARADLAFVAMATGDGDHAAAVARGLALREAMGPDWVRRDELDHLVARAQHALGDVEAACRLLEPLAVRARAAQTEVSLPAVHNELAGCYLDAGDAQRAAEVADLGLGAARELGWAPDPDLANLAATAVWAYLERGDALYAALKAQDYLAVLGDDAPAPARAGLLWNEALARSQVGQHRTALALMNRAAALMTESERRLDATRATLAKAWLQLRAPDPDPVAVIEVLTDTHARLEAQNMVLDVATCEVELARAHLLAGDAQRARDLAERARHRLGPQHRRESADAAALLAQALLRLDPAADVEDLLAEARSHLLDTRPTRSAALGLAQLSQTLEQAGDQAGALAAARQALEATGVRSRWDALAPDQQPSAPPR